MLVKGGKIKSSDVTVIDIADYYISSNVEDILQEIGSSLISSNEFTKLTDTPASYSGQGLKGVRVNVGEDALEFYTTVIDTDEKVSVDSDATAGYIGAASSDGVLRTGSNLSYVDGGDFITLNVDSTKSSNWDSAYSHISSDGSSHSFINQDVTTSGTPIFDSATIGSVVIPTLFTDALDPTGFTNRTDSVLSWDDATYTLTITDTHYIYINGVKSTKGTGSIQITDSTGIHWIYYDDDGNLAESLDTDGPGWQYNLIATVYWNTTTNKGLVGDERHGHKMDFLTHSYLHNSVGTRYVSGLTGTFGDTTFDTTLGVIYDEDIDHQISAQTTCNVLYKDGSAEYKWLENQTKYYYEDGGSNINYNNGNTLTAMDANKYVAYWIFATNDTSKPIVSLMGQRQDTTIADARTNNKYESLTLGTLPFKEMKLLYRVILRNDVTPYEETQDLRSVSNLPAGTYVATSHSVLTNLLVDDHSQYALLAGRSGGQELFGSTVTAEDLTLTDNSVDNNSITVTQAITAYSNRVDTWGDGLQFSSNTASVDYNTTNLKITSTELNTIQDIATTSSPQFVGLTLTGSASITGDLTVLGTEFIADVESVTVEDNLMIVNYGETGASVTAVQAGMEIDRGTSNDYAFLFNDSSDTFRVGEIYTTVTVDNVSGTFSALDEITAGSSPYTAKAKVKSVSISEGAGTMVVNMLFGAFSNDEEITNGTATGDVNGAPVDSDDTQAVATRQDAPVDTGVAYWNNTDSRFDTVAGFTFASGTLTSTSFTDGTATLTGGNLTGMGNITGTDVDLSLGTGDITTTGTLDSGAITSTGNSQFGTIGVGGTSFNAWVASFHGDIGTDAGRNFTFNTYYDSGFKYVENGNAYRIRSGDNADASLAGLIFYVAPNNTSGAGAALTFTQAMKIRANTDVGFAKNLLSGNGAAGTPAHSFTSDTDTGMYSISADSLGLATEGILALSIDNAQNVSVTQNIYVPAGKYIYFGASGDGVKMSYNTSTNKFVVEPWV